METVLDTVHSAEEDAFQGLFLDTLPRHGCTTDGKWLCLTTRWRSLDVIVAIRLSDGHVKRLHTPNTLAR